MEDKQIETVENWPEPKLIRDIQVFLGFANFYQRFIQSLSKIARPLTLILRMSFITRLLKNLLLWINVAEIDEIDVGGGDPKNETVGRSLSKNSNKATNYLTSMLDSFYPIKTNVYQSTNPLTLWSGLLYSNWNCRVSLR